MSDAPDELKGKLLKKSPNVLKFGAFQWRYVKLNGGKLSYSLLDGEEAGADRGEVDLCINTVQVEEESGSETVFKLSPSGRWTKGDFTGAEADRAFIFDANGSPHNRDQWVKAMKAHVDYGARNRPESAAAYVDMSSGAQDTGSTQDGDGYGASGGTGDGNYPPNGIAPSVKKLEGWIQAGCGDKPYNCPEKSATFAIDGQCPATMPDLSKHSNFLAEHLTKDIYAQLKDKKTKNGITLAQCIKTGVDNPGHPQIKTVGMTACDEECYETFKAIFDPVTSARHGGYDLTKKQPTNLDIGQLSNTDIDPDLKYVLTTRVRTGRSVRGFMLPPTISFEDRRKLEALCIKALLAMDGDLKGDYFPLNGSRSYDKKPNGMTEEKEEKLRKCGNLFQEPDSTLLLASGMGRHWPDGRGIFHNNNEDLFVWLNEEDHLRIVSMQGSRDKPSEKGKNIKEVTARFIRACDEVQKVLKKDGYEFMHNNNLGWVLTCPSNLGTGLRAGTMVKLPKVSARPDWKQLCSAMSLQARGTGGVDSASTGGTWDVSNADRIGKGEVDLVNTLIEGAAKLVEWESMYDSGEDGEADKAIKAAIEGYADG